MKIIQTVFHINPMCSETYLSCPVCIIHHTYFVAYCSFFFSVGVLKGLPFDCEHKQVRWILQSKWTFFLLGFFWREWNQFHLERLLLCSTQWCQISDLANVRNIFKIIIKLLHFQKLVSHVYIVDFSPEIREHCFSLKLNSDFLQV